MLTAEKWARQKERKKTHYLTPREKHININIQHIPFLIFSLSHTLLSFSQLKVETVSLLHIIYDSEVWQRLYSIILITAVRSILFYSHLRIKEKPELRRVRPSHQAPPRQSMDVSPHFLPFRVLNLNHNATLPLCTHMRLYIITTKLFFIKKHKHEGKWKNEISKTRSQTIVKRP